jgi:hypothetical protein
MVVFVEYFHELHFCYILITCPYIHLPTDTHTHTHIYITIISIVQSEASFKYILHAYI